MIVRITRTVGLTLLPARGLFVGRGFSSLPSCFLCVKVLAPLMRGAGSTVAARRSDADTALLIELRKALALIWDLLSESYPSRREFLQNQTYDYTYDHGLGFSTKDYTAEELMDYFKNYSKEVFPFLCLAMCQARLSSFR